MNIASHRSSPCARRAHSRSRAARQPQRHQTGLATSVAVRRPRPRQLSRKVRGRGVPLPPVPTVVVSNLSSIFYLSLVSQLNAVRAQNPFLPKRPPTRVPRGPCLPRWQPVASAECPPPQRGDQPSSKSYATGSRQEALPIAASPALRQDAVDQLLPICGPRRLGVRALRVRVCGSPWQPRQRFMIQEPSPPS